MAPASVRKTREVSCWAAPCAVVVVASGRSSSAQARSYQKTAPSESKPWYSDERLPPIESRLLTSIEYRCVGNPFQRMAVA